MFQITPHVMRYPWGSAEAVTRILGIPNPGGEPVAELWYGAHVRGPSLVGDGSRTLREELGERGDELIGPELVNRYGGELPFLFKVLSAEKGLSIQAHPSKSQAEEGFAREDRDGIPRDAPHRNYRDDNHKPEGMLALEDFWALSGFRSPEDIAEGLRSAGAKTLSGELLSALENAPETGNSRSSGDGNPRLREFYRRLMLAPREDQLALLSELLAEIPESVSLRDDDPRWYWIAELNRQFPDDPGALAPLYLNVILLKPGQVLYMDAGLLHAYLRGTGFEIMANSDNVLRGGCTGKHVDVAELLKVLRFTDSPPLVSRAHDDGWYDSPFAEFQIAWMRPGAAEHPDFRSSSGLGTRPAIILVREGKIHIEEGGAVLDLKRGQGCFVPAGDTDILLRSAEKSSFALATIRADLTGGAG
jgi:mannose-6-phosphate isomerase